MGSEPETSSFEELFHTGELHLTCACADGCFECWLWVWAFVGKREGGKFTVYRPNVELK